MAEILRPTGTTEGFVRDEKTGLLVPENINEISVPIEQQGEFLCGYASIAALLRLNNYYATQFTLFEKDHGYTYGEERQALRNDLTTAIKRADAPGLASLAQDTVTEEQEAYKAAQKELSLREIAVFRDTSTSPVPLITELYGDKKWEELKAKNPKYTPEFMLEFNIVQRGVPCMVRVPGHWKLITGIDYTNDTYIAADPFWGKRDTIKRNKFINRWKEREEKGIGSVGGRRLSGKYLMIMIRPDRKTNATTQQK